MDMNREIKFRAWCKQREEWIDIRRIFFNECESSCVEDYDGEIYFPERKDWELMQYTGLKDAKGIEIYEYSELDGDYEVIFKDLRYSLRYIPNNDIIDLQDYWRDKNGEIEVTREYTKV